MQACRILLLTLLTWLGTLAGSAMAHECGWCGLSDCEWCGFYAGPHFLSRPDSFLGSATLDTVALERSGVDDQELLFSGNFNNPVMNNRDLNFDVEAGLRFDLVLPGECGCDLNINILAVHDFHDSITRSDPNLTFSFFDLGPAVPAASYTVHYSSDLTSYEMNLRTQSWSRLAPLVGFRVVELDEEFHIFETGTSTGFFSTSSNTLLGVQFGLHGSLWQHCRWSIEALLKGGVYYNDAEVTADAANPNGPAFDLDTSSQQTAFVGEVQLTAVYQVSPRMRLRAGYQGLWLDGVALAPDQADSSSFATGLTRVDLGTAVYHGGFLGFELTW